MTTTTPHAMSIAHVYTAISEVTKSLAKEGIKKNRKNDSQGYFFRGIDDVYNALSAILPEHGLVILPEVKLRECSERTGRNGSVIFVVNVMVDFKFVSIKDGSTHTITMCGEAMDSSDKATNKAISAAYKYCCLTSFCIPTEGDNDADASHIELKALKEQALNKLKIKEPALIEDTTPRPEIEDRFITIEEFEQMVEIVDKLDVSMAAVCNKLKIEELALMKLTQFKKAYPKFEELLKTKEAK